MMKKFLNNLGSRKFLVALVSIISGILTLANCDDSLIQFICGLIMTVVPAIVYIITEGVLDYTSIGVILEDVAEIINQYIEEKKQKEKEEAEKSNDVTVLIEDTIEIAEVETEKAKDGIIIDT